MSIENKIPIYVSGDENCLCNAISVNLFGNEKLATQIRVLTCIEMVMNTSLYDNEKYQRLILVSPSYDIHAKILLSRELIRRHVLCLLHLLQLGVPYSLYPPRNGILDTSVGVLNTTFQPVSLKSKMHSNNVDKFKLWVQQNLAPKPFCSFNKYGSTVTARKNFQH